MRWRLVIVSVVAWLLTATGARTQSAEWFTYTDFAVGYAFDYPAEARVSVEGEAVYVALNQRPPYQGYVIVVLDNSANRSLAQFLAARPDDSLFRPTHVNGLEAAVDDAATAYWITLKGAVIKIELTTGDHGSIEPAPATRAARAAFDRALASFRSIPRLPGLIPAPTATAVPQTLRPNVAVQFGSPFNLPSTTQYETQWDIITSDTRYGVRNLALPGSPRKCFNVTWPRMLHSGMDLYRADGIDTTGLTVQAVADGQVAFYDPAYAAYPGRVVIVSHVLTDSRTIYSMYAHLGSVSVFQGQLVSSGQPIGTILYQPGDSHLHFEMRWFLDGHSLYPVNTSCNSVPSFYYGRGYTYLIHPDDFPPGSGYTNPDAFIQAHGGPALTPIGLPDPYAPKVTLSALSQSLSLSREPIGVAQPSTIDKSIVTTDTLTYTVNLPLIVRSEPRLEPACVEGQELLSNGGFEDGPGSAPWVQVRNNASDLISAAWPFSGAYSLWLSGRDTADDEALQAFVVPYYTDGLTVTFKRLLTTQETEPVVYDHFEIVIENNVGNELSPQIGLSNVSPGQGGWISEQAAFAGFAAWGNQRVRLSIKGMSDGNLVTSLYLDEVSVQTRCAP
jgi:murein DD-endopeptidase MepM/ murein hydrolase activator NlpD